jgi:hypothetical protein
VPDEPECSDRDLAREHFMAVSNGGDHVEPDERAFNEPRIEVERTAVDGHREDAVRGLSGKLHDEAVDQVAPGIGDRAIA